MAVDNFLTRFAKFKSAKYLVMLTSDVIANLKRAFLEAALKYFKKAENSCRLPSKFQANEHLTADDTESANKQIKLEIEVDL